MYTVQHYSTDVMEFSTTLSCRKYLTVKKRFEIRIQLCTCLNTFMFITFTKTLIDYFVFWKRSFLNIRIRLIFLLCTTRSVFFFKLNLRLIIQIATLINMLLSIVKFWSCTFILNITFYRFLLEKLCGKSISNILLYCVIIVYFYISIADRL